jgi:hypothetical protein
MPIVTLLDGTRGFLLTAAIGAPLFALLVIADYWRVMRRARSKLSSDASPCRATP